MWYTKQTVLSWLRFPNLCRYVSRRHSDTLKTGYIIISYVTNGTYAFPVVGDPPPGQDSPYKPFSRLSSNHVITKQVPFALHRVADFRQ
jgi:hypothetical protein